MFLAKETPPFSKCTQRVAKYLCAGCCRWLGSASIFGKEAIALVATYWRSARNRATRGSIAKSIRVRMRYSKAVGLKPIGSTFDALPMP